eukprot:6215398-Amphidinium_carterae.1
MAWAKVLQAVPARMSPSTLPLETNDSVRVRHLLARSQCAVDVGQVSFEATQGLAYLHSKKVAMQ